MQAEPWSHPAACSDCLSKGTAALLYVATVSIIKKEKSQLHVLLRSRTFARPGKQIADDWST